MDKLRLIGTHATATNDATTRGPSLSARIDDLLFCASAVGLIAAPLVAAASTYF